MSLLPRLELRHILRYLLVEPNFAFFHQFRMADVVATTFVSDAISNIVSSVIGSFSGTSARLP